MKTEYSAILDDVVWVEIEGLDYHVGFEWESEWDGDILKIIPTDYYQCDQDGNESELEPSKEIIRACLDFCDDNKGLISPSEYDEEGNNYNRWVDSEISYSYRGIK